MYHLKECGTAYRGYSPECKFQEYHSDSEVIKRNSMKSVTYEFDWTHILPVMVGAYGIEDGFWRVELIMESMTGLINPVVEGQVQATLPGVQHRIAGFKLVKADGFGSMTFKVTGGTVTYASYTDNSGPDESSESIGGDQGYPERVTEYPLYPGK